MSDVYEGLYEVGYWLDPSGNDQHAAAVWAAAQHMKRQDKRLEALESRLGVREVGKTCEVWRRSRFGEPDLVRAALHICEEAGEVARAALKTAQGIREHDRGNLADELADVIMTTAAMAEEQGIDLDAAIRRRIARLETLTYGGE